MNMNASSPAALRHQAESLAEEGKWDEAIAIWQQLEQLDPHSADAAEESARLIVARKVRGGGVKHFAPPKAALRTLPEYPTYFRRSGDLAPEGRQTVAHGASRRDAGATLSSYFQFPPEPRRGVRIVRRSRRLTTGRGAC